MALDGDHDAGGEAADERVWPARLRWRLRGAWQWPTFIAMTVIDAVVLAELPFSGEDGSLMGGLLGAGFLNLAIVAVLAPLGGWVLHRRRPQHPRAVAADRAGTALLVALGVAFLAGGIANRSHVTAARGDYAAGLAAARRWFAHNEPAVYVAHGGQESVWHPGGALFRTCLPSAQPGRDVCVYVDTSGPNVTVTRDRDQQPNSVIAGADNPGRQAR
jgi:hypothetical protein